MKQIILKYTDSEWETEYLQIEGNLVFSVCCIGYNFFLNFYETTKDKKAVERISIPIEYDFATHDFSFLLQHDEAETILISNVHSEVESYIEDYLDSEEIALDLSMIANDLAQMLEVDCKEVARLIREKELRKQMDSKE